MVQNWYGYGAPLTAIAAGTVVRTRSDAPEHSAMTLVAPDIIEANEALGNAIILDIGDGRYLARVGLRALVAV